MDFDPSAPASKAHAMDAQSPLASLIAACSAPFRSGKRLNALLVALFLLINGIVAVNAAIHHPAIGYDGLDHLTYIAALAERRFPLPKETREYFSPPLPYFLPSVFYRSCIAQGIGTDWQVPFIKPCLFLGGKVAQAQNLALSLLLTFCLLKICDILRPGSSTLKVHTLLLLAVLPVYYRTFALVRGEALVATFTVIVVYQLLAMFARRDYSILRVGGLGISCGLLLLSRQWGVFVLLAIVGWTFLLLVRDRRHMWPFARSVALSMIVAALASGWFYIGLRLKYGQATAFNRQPLPNFSLANQPRDFYFGTGLPQLWTAPVRPSFPNQLMPILYADTWGDYWGYFLVTGFNPRKGQDWAASNIERIQPYLGRVDMVAVVPSLLLMLGCLSSVFVIRKILYRRAPLDLRDSARSLLGCIFLVSLLGYLWFLISFPNPGKGDTIKATYIIHVLVLAPLLGGDLLQRLSAWARPLYFVLIALVVCALIYTLPAMVSRYPYFFFFQ